MKRKQTPLKRLTHFILAPWRWLVQPKFTDDPQIQSQVRLFLTLLVPFILLTLMGVAFNSLDFSNPFVVANITVVFLMIGAYFLGRTRFYLWGVGLLVIVISLFSIVGVITRQAYTPYGIMSALAWSTTAVIFGSIFLPIWASALVVVGNAFMMILLPVFIPEIAFRSVVTPLSLLIGVSVLVLISDVHRNGLERMRQNELKERNQELEAVKASLEDRVAERTRRITIAAAISEQLSSILNLDELMTEIVNQVKENFNFYHAHIYLFDKAEENLVMSAGTGLAGAEMKGLGHKIPVSAVSLVARAARTGKVVRVDNVREAKDWLPNPLLPDTYSEMAVPIILKEKVVGVLDVQDDEIAGLSEDDANILRNLANQVAVTINNAQLFAEVEKQLADAQTLQERYIEQTWDRSRITRRSAGRVQYSPESTSGLNEEILTISRQQALAQTEPTAIILNGSDSADTSETGPAENRTHIAMVAPISLRNTIIGNLQLHGFDPGKDWTEAELALINTVIDQVAQTAEALRLFEETQERAARERLVSEMSNKMRRAGDMETLMQITVNELTEALGTSRTFVRLRNDQQTDDNQKALPAQTNKPIG